MSILLPPFRFLLGAGRRFLNVGDAESITESITATTIISANTVITTGT